MKHRLIILISLFVVVCSSALAQAKKPTLMVVPSDGWCIKNGYTQTFDNMGTSQTLPDYKAAVQQNSDLSLVIAKINELMSDRGFPLVDLQQSLKSLNNVNAERALVQSKSTGAGVKESPLDQLRRTAKADIMMEVEWTINQTGPKKSITYILKGLDSYSNKEVAGASGTGAPSFSAEIPVLLEEAVLDKMDNFCARLQTHFDDMMTNGREIVLELGILDDGLGVDFETEYEGEELTDIIDSWMNDNTVNHRYSMAENTETNIVFNQVRIPLYKTNGTAPLDTRGFANGLVKFLKAAPYNLPCKLVNQGLGRCTIYIGDK